MLIFIEFILPIAIILFSVYSILKAAQRKRRVDEKLRVLSANDASLLPVMLKIHNNERLEAIKAYREIKGCDLYEAKRAVEMLSNQ